jgi:hypothetical protein
MKGWGTTALYVVLLATKGSTIRPPHGLTAVSSCPRIFSSGNRDDSDLRLSSEGPALSRSELNSSYSHGGESTHLQLVPRVCQNEMVRHVSTPPTLSFVDGLPSTRVDASVSRHQQFRMSEPHVATSPLSRNVQPWSARHKGKALICQTPIKILFL